MTGRQNVRREEAPVLLRLESKVETKINGHEEQLWVECTARAKASTAYWKVLGA